MFFSFVHLSLIGKLKKTIFLCAILLSECKRFRLASSPGGAASRQTGLTNHPHMAWLTQRFFEWPLPWTEKTKLPYYFVIFSTNED
jgi:hypothetical protein